MAGIDIAIWTASGILAAIYLMTGLLKLLQPAKAQGMSPVLAAVQRPWLRAIGAAEILGAIGVILAPLLDVLWVAAVAAAGLGLIQALAIPRHIKMKDTRGLPINILLLALALFVAVGRSGAIP